VLVLLAGEEPRSILFCRERNPERELWEGVRKGPEGAKAAFGFEEAYPWSRSTSTCRSSSPISLSFTTPRGRPGLGRTHHGMAESGAGASTRRRQRAAEIRDVRTALDEMRVFKDDGELAVMRRAAAISVTAHERAMRANPPGRSEIRDRGGASLRVSSPRRPVSPPTGPSLPESNACILHYRDNDARSPTGIFCSSTRVASWTGMPRM